jgi:hypothetical protein
MLVTKMRSVTLILAIAFLIAIAASMALAAEAAPAATAQAPVVVAAPAPAVQVHGYMQNRGYFGPGANPEFRSERISISAIANLPDDSTGYTEVYYHPWAPSAGLYLESAYYDTPMAGGRLRVGKGRRMTFGITPAYPNRKTSNYGIVSEAFTQDRIQGVQYMTQKGVLDFGASLHTGSRLGTRNIGEIPGDSVRNVTHQVQHLVFRDANAGGGSPSKLSGRPALSTRVGGKWPNGFKAGLSLYLSSLDPDDLTALTTASASNLLTISSASVPALLPGATSKTMNVVGGDFTYNMPSSLVLQGEYYRAKVSSLDYNAWNVLAGWGKPTTWRFYARYSQQNMDIVPTTNPLTWDTRQISLSAVQPLRKGLWLQYEYERNLENPVASVAKVKNDLFFIELFTGF